MSIIVTVFSLYDMRMLLAYARMSIYKEGSIYDRRKGSVCVFTLFGLVSVVIKTIMQVSNMWMVIQYRRNKQMRDDEERIMNTSKPEDHI